MFLDLVHAMIDRGEGVSASRRHFLDLGFSQAFLDEFGDRAWECASERIQMAQRAKAARRRPAKRARARS